MIQRRFTNEEDAKEWYVQELRRKKRVEAGMDESMGPQIFTVSDYAKIFMKRRVGDEKVVKGTWRTDGQRFEDYILPLLGERVLQSVKSTEWTQALNMIQSDPENVLKIGKKKAPTDEAKALFEKKIQAGRKPLSNTTRNRIRTLINTMYNEAIKIDKIAYSNPMAQVEVKDEGDSEEKSDFWETKEECRAYLDAQYEIAKERGFYGYWLWANFSIYSGARIGELLALKHQDIKIDQGRIRLNKIYDPNVKKDVYRTKGSRKSKSGGRKRSSRWLYLTPEIVAAYRVHVQNTAYNKATDHVFMNTRDSSLSKIKNQGNRTTLSGITKAHLKACERAEVRVIRVHDVRHTFGAHFMMNGGDLTTLGKILGQSNQWVTARYGHLSESYLSQEVLRVSYNDVKRDATVMPQANSVGRTGGKKK